MECNFTNTPFEGKFQILHSSPTYFCASSYIFRDIQFLNCLSSKSRSNSRSVIFAIRWYITKSTNVSNICDYCVFVLAIFVLSVTVYDLISIEMCMTLALYFGLGQGKL